jgi:predicted enzyme related to lactoylglutathione lyase
MAKKKTAKRKAPKRAKRATVAKPTASKKSAARKPAAATPKAGAPLTRGRFVWYELMTPDPEAAKRFYTQVISWGTQRYDKDPSYTMWTAGGSTLGGLMRLPEEARRMGAPPNWMAYITTPDVDATARQATGLGGKIVNGPMDLPDIGRFAVIQDPQGAVVAAYRSSGWSPTHAGDKVGEFSWHELATTNYKAALEFYRALFGWETTQGYDMGGLMGIYQTFGRAGKMMGGMFNKTPDTPGPPSWLYYVSVDSADRVAEKVKAAGGKVLHGPTDVPGGDRIAQCMDPQGAAFGVHAKKR